MGIDTKKLTVTKEQFKQQVLHFYHKDVLLAWLFPVFLHKDELLKIRGSMSLLLLTAE